MTLHSRSIEFHLIRLYEPHYIMFDMYRSLHCIPTDRQISVMLLWVKGDPKLGIVCVSRSFRTEWASTRPTSMSFTSAVARVRLARGQRTLRARPTFQPSQKAFQTTLI